MALGISGRMRFGMTCLSAGLWRIIGGPGLGAKEDALDGGICEEDFERFSGAGVTEEEVAACQDMKACMASGLRMSEELAVDAIDLDGDSS